MNLSDESQILTHYYLSTAGHGFSSIYNGTPFQKGNGFGKKYD